MTNFAGKDRDFAGKQFLNEELPPVIENACFEQKRPYTETFKPNSKTTFRGCNMNGVKLPEGCTLENSPNNQLTIYNNETWVVSEGGILIEVFK